MISIKTGYDRHCMFQSKALHKALLHEIQKLYANLTSFNETVFLEVVSIPSFPVFRTQERLEKTRKTYGNEALVVQAP